MKLFDDDYGWLEPDGSFHPVKWGEHQIWADEWMQKVLPCKEYIKFSDKELFAGDYLTQKGWILLHNPACGIAHISRNENCRVTKAQKKFLYGYFWDRGLYDEAANVLQL